MMQHFFESINEWLFKLDISDVIAIFAIIISIISIIVSYRANKRNNKLTALVNSAEFELYKKLKYDTFDMIAKLKAIDAIAALSPHSNKKIDSTREIDLLKELQASPVYLLMLYSVKDNEERLNLELRVRFLTTFNFSSDERRGWIHKIINSLEKNIDFERFSKMDFDILIKELCKMESIYTKFDLNEWENRHNNEAHHFLMFTNYLIDECKVKDPNVLLLHGAIKGDTEIVKKAIDEGANVKVTDKQIIERYKADYKNFTNGTIVPETTDGLKDKNETSQETISKGGNDNLKESHGSIDFEKFVNYLIDERKVNDPDVLLFYGVIKGDAEIVKKAIDEGANVNVTDIQIIERYKADYVNFINK